MSHRYDDDPMAYVPYRPRTITVSTPVFVGLCAFATLGFLALLLVLFVS